MKFKSRDLISIREQAMKAAEFYLKRGPGPIYVFPCGRTGNSVQFRRRLSANLAKSICDNREFNEIRCARLGYPFIEIDPAEYWGARKPRP